jgi:hypothetical protein
MIRMIGGLLGLDRRRPNANREECSSRDGGAE